MNPHADSVPSQAQIDEVVYACRQQGSDTTYDIVRAALARFGTRPAAEPQYADSFGYSLAMEVLQSDLYRELALKARAECDELISRGQLKPAAEPIQSSSAGEADEVASFIVAVKNFTLAHRGPLPSCYGPDMDAIAAKVRALAALSRQAPAAPAEAVWANFPSYLIDHCEGATITEEGLQRWLAAMLKDQKYAAPTPPAPTQALLGWTRYEKARKLNPAQWAELHQRNLRGGNFDDMIDALPATTKPVQQDAVDYDFCDGVCDD